MRKLRFFSLLLLILILHGAAALSASECTLFGPTSYFRSTGKPQVIMGTFSVPNSQDPVFLRLTNGDPGGTRRVSSAEIRINGVPVLRPDDFNQQVGERLIPLSGLRSTGNTISVELNSKPGSYVLLDIVSLHDSETVLIVGADFSPPIAELLSTGHFTQVDFFNSVFGTPTLNQLQGYDAVLAYTNYVPQDGVALGNVLADYIDAGGHLVIATYSFSSPWAIFGRITDPGYAPLVNVGINADVSGALVPTISSDPIFDGINLGVLSYYHNGNFAHPGLDPGAVLLATDGNGVNMIGRRGCGIVGVNLFPASFFNNNIELHKLIANALD